jgi:hypothetical protein
MLVLLLLLTMLLLSIDGFLPVLWMNNSNTTTTAKIALTMCVCVLRMASNMTAPVTNPLEASWQAEGDRTCQTPKCDAWQRSSFIDRNDDTRVQYTNFNYNIVVHQLFV